MNPEQWVNAWIEYWKSLDLDPSTLSFNPWFNDDGTADREAIKERWAAIIAEVPDQ